MGQRLAQPCLPLWRRWFAASGSCPPSDPELGDASREHRVRRRDALQAPIRGRFRFRDRRDHGVPVDGSPGSACPVNLTAGTDSWSTQLPIALVGAHGGERWQRVVLAVDLYPDYNETGAAMDLFGTVHAIYGESLHAFIYDRLMRGGSMREIMQHGVVPLVDMQGASPTAPE